ncbi:hypothetical protein [Raineya sp.]|jgi:hypothetical protein
MRKSHFLFAILLMFLFVGQTIAQNIEGAARMDAMTSENLAMEKANPEKATLSNSVSTVKPLEKTAPIEISNAPLTTNKVVKGERIKKNLKPSNQSEESKLGLGKLGVVGLILIIVGIILLIVFWPVGVIFTIIGLVLLLLELV